MSEHPIEGLMTTAMQSIKEMVDVNTIVGDAVQAPDGTVIIPISRVAFGFAAGGGEYNKKVSKEKSKSDDETDDVYSSYKGQYPFAGGSGAGVSIQPVAFMIVGKDYIKLLPVNVNSTLDRILDLFPEMWEKAQESIKRKIIVKKEFKNSENAKRAEADYEKE